ncbi:MAG: zf-HC2 domain-containing protein [Acidobacteriota bacterium]|nr:zf-HC2 domain-containing protein [Acidobacteriota bacterium]
MRRRHIAQEELSAYLDDETGAGEERRIDSHLAGCAECRERLDATRGLLVTLHRMERATPPPELAAQVRQATAGTSSGGPLRSLLRLFFELPLRPALSTPLAMGLALLLSFQIVERGLGQLSLGSTAGQEPRFRVEVDLGVGPRAYSDATTSQVAGRVFVLTNNVWSQQGLDRTGPVDRVAVGSREGREVLAKFSDLGVLLADGSRVVLTYNLRTLELRSGA